MTPPAVHAEHVIGDGDPEGVREEVCSRLKELEPVVERHDPAARELTR